METVPEVTAYWSNYTLGQTVDQLVQAREFFAEHGGALGLFYDSAKDAVCAYGAIGAVMDDDFRDKFNDEFDFPSAVLSSNAVKLLDKAAKILFDKDAADANDYLGIYAVLGIYDYAIKLGKAALEERHLD